MGIQHARAVAENPDAGLVAVASRRIDVGRESAARWGCRAYADYRELLADSNIEAVVIATATAEHPEHILAAAQAKKHIFTEKPIALTLSDADRVCRAVAENGVQCMVGFMRRFDPAYAAAKEKIRRGSIGRPVTYLSISRDPIWPAHVDDDPRVSGGFWLDIGVHEYDLAAWLMDQPIRQVYAVGNVLVYPRLKEFDDMDNGIVTFRFADGAIGSADLSRNARYGYDIRTEVLGSEGSVWIGSIQQTALQVLTAQGVTHDVYPWYLDRFAEAFRREMNAFIAGLNGGQLRLSPDAEDGRRALRVALAVRESWHSGHPVEIA